MKINAGRFWLKVVIALLAVAFVTRNSGMDASLGLAWALAGGLILYGVIVTGVLALLWWSGQ